MYKSLAALSLICVMLAQTATASPELETEMAMVEQNLHSYNHNPAFNTGTVEDRKAQYLDEHYSPWHDQFRWNSSEDMKTLLHNAAEAYLNGNAWGVSRQPISKVWLTQVIDNMDLASFPNANHNAITVSDVDLRLFPTHEPVYDNWDKAGEGHPFDYLQNSHIYFNKPVYLLHTSKDKAWQLVVVGDNSIGWVPANSVVTVSSFVQKQLEQTKQHATPLLPKQNIQVNDRFIAKTHLGQVFPVEREVDNEFKIKVVIDNGSQQGKIVKANLSKTQLAEFPLQYDAATLAMLGNQLHSTPYGWGGIYGYLDCSQLMQSLFSAVGVWLPRNSRDQAQLVDGFVDLSSYSLEDKSRMLKANGIPFHTLIYLPGHIGLYLGFDDDNIYMFHTPWALRTQIEGSEAQGRDIIGRALVTTLDLGTNLANIPATWLDKMSGYRVLLPE